MDTYIKFFMALLWGVLGGKPLVLFTVGFYLIVKEKIQN